MSFSATTPLIQSRQHRPDFLIVGGGILGISIALALKRRFPDQSIVVLEKETQCGAHSSGRNSGVIHAGFYYSADSLKAKLTRIGNERLTQYCLERNLPIRRCGKLVVARNESELASLDELFNRGQKNGVTLKNISEQEAKEIEPRVKTFQRALFSPNTSSADPIGVLRSLEGDCEKSGIQIHRRVQFLGVDRESTIMTSDGNYQTGFFINAAGLYADQVARNFGFSEKYRIVPFKGLYLYSDEPVGSFRTNIYPTPDLKNPFLGVHFTLTVTGNVKIGPTAIPAFWREQYDGFKNMKLPELIDIGFRNLGLFFKSDFDFRRLALQEMKKYSRKRMVHLAAELAHQVEARNYTHWGPPGIRAQLMDIEKKKLEMDFVIQADNRSLHVLNAVSPGWTCSLSFADYVCDQMKG